MIILSIWSAGTFSAAGGSGGSSAEHGGPGTIYLHRLPPDDSTIQIDATHDSSIITHTSNVTGVLTNRTLYIDNHGQTPKDRERNLTVGYLNLRVGTSCAWVIPSQYPSFVEKPEKAGNEEIIIDYVQIYGEGQLAFINNICLSCNIDIRVAAIYGLYFISHNVWCLLS